MTHHVVRTPADHAVRRWSHGRARLVFAFLLLSLVWVAPLILPHNAQAAGTIPAGLPSHFMLGLANNPDQLTWMTASKIPWDIRYQYLAGGANTGDGWATWNTNGGFATSYMNASASAGYLPVLTYYQILQSAPAYDEYENMQNASTMKAYYADFKLLLSKVKAFGKPVIIHVEPDLFGVMQQRVVGSTNSATSIPTKVAASGDADLAGLPDTFQGFNWALLKLRDKYAPNAIMAAHVSHWSTNIDIGSNDDPNLDVARIIQQTVAFHKTAGLVGNPSGVSTYDLLFFDPLDRDAAYYQYVRGDGGARWWDTTNQTFPNFARYEQYVKGITDGTSRRAMLWQVPIGNTLYRSVNNTDGHYQDNRVQYWLGGYPNDGHIRALADAGVIGILWGRGASGPTTYTDAKGDGITNPAAINGNTQVAQYADDDGGYLRLMAQRYYQTGVYRFGAGTQPTATAARTATATPARTATPTPARTATPTPTPTQATDSMHMLPGRIQVENYRSGGEGVGYHDTTRGNTGGMYRSDDVDIERCSSGRSCYNVGWLDTGEWLAYNVTVKTTGTYRIYGQVATPRSGQSFYVTVDGVNVSGNIAVPVTGGWDTWANTSAKTVSLKAGTHTLKIVANTPDFNWNWINVARAINP